MKCPKCKTNEVEAGYCNQCQAEYMRERRKAKQISNTESAPPLSVSIPKPVIVETLVESIHSAPFHETAFERTKRILGKPMTAEEIEALPPMRTPLYFSYWMSVPSNKAAFQKLESQYLTETSK